MNVNRPMAPIIIHTNAEIVSEIDALAAATNRSRDDLVTQALEQYLEVNAWQAERIKAGIAAANEGRLRPAESVFADIAAKHHWNI